MTTPGFEEVDEERLLAGGDQSSEFSAVNKWEWIEQMRVNVNSVIQVDWPTDWGRTHQRDDDPRFWRNGWRWPKLRLLAGEKYQSPEFSATKNESECEFCRVGWWTHQRDDYPVLKWTKLFFERAGMSKLRLLAGISNQSPESSAVSDDDQMRVNVKIW